MSHPLRSTSILLLIASVALFGLTTEAVCAQNIQDLLDTTADRKGVIFAPGVISSPDSSESSPSITADGSTLVFTRYANYGQQVPYIATRIGHSEHDDAWDVQRAPFAEFVYNLAISPDGQTILYRPPRRGNSASKPTSRVFRVQKQPGGKWSDAEEIEELRKTRAGYFDLQEDGTLYLYARPGESDADPNKPRGVYRTHLNVDGSTEPLTFVGLHVSPSGSNTFDPDVFRNGRQMIVTRAGISAEEEETLGRKGFYLHRRSSDGWTKGQRLKLPYGWGATILPDSRMLYVHDGDLYVVSL
ncbi:hypothetical protein CRI94_10315 [Longibacter salinarum]|uniref:Uncharacterized protein n=1 Tax=Longibacter salinarum TaxID=1850348 RepID=A0A2A8CWQ1_9BACT|nr:PD40 domain-containing protein [Longibacter salinarum]PEN13040.1 hypothetical protein CRI94_10315 [Longibacter salinarum]